MKNFLLFLVALGIVRGGFYAYEMHELNKTTPAPVVTTGYDTEVKPESGWTKYKDVVYNSCVDAGGVNNLQSYCKCATNYMVDTYGVSQITAWDGKPPQSVLDTVVDKCL